jgi:hypothetical protein
VFVEDVPIFESIRPWGWELQLWWEQVGDWPQIEGHKPPGQAAKNARCRVCGKPGDLRKYKRDVKRGSFMVLCRPHALRWGVPLPLCGHD